MQSEQCIVVKDKEQNILGYGLSIQTPENKIIGPIAAKNDAMAMRIVHDLARGHHGKLRIDVPEGKKDFMKELQIIGFQKVNTPPIMMKNSDQLLKGIMSYIALQHKFLAKKSPFHVRILFRSFNHDIGHE